MFRRMDSFSSGITSMFSNPEPRIRTFSWEPGSHSSVRGCSYGLAPLSSSSILQWSRVVDPEPRRANWARESVSVSSSSVALQWSPKLE